MTADYAYEHPLEEVHRLLEQIEHVQRTLAAENRKRISVTDVPELCEVVLELLGWTHTAYMENLLNISPALLSKFVKMQGSVQVHVARAVTDRIRSYLRSQDQRSPSSSKTKAKSEKEKEQEPPKVTLAAERWTVVGSSLDIKARITAIAELLDTIIEQTTRANAPPDQQALSAIERQQLIAVLQTALNLLQSPLAEKGLLESARGALRKGAEKAAEKGVQQGLGKIMETAGQKIADLVQLIF